MKKFIVLLLLLLTACNTDDSPSKNQPTNNEPNKPATHTEKPAKNQIHFADYFMPNKTIASFEGYGNEYASYTLRTTWLDDHYVATIVDNGGATVERIYRLTNTQVELILDKVIDGSTENATFPTVEELEKLTAKQVYLSGPIQIGTTFGNWTIVETNTKLETPYKIFDNVFVIEETEDGFKNRHYFVKGYGEVKREAIMQVDGSNEQETISSTLKGIEYE